MRRCADAACRRAVVPRCGLPGHAQQLARHAGLLCRADGPQQLQSWGTHHPCWSTPRAQHIVCPTTCKAWAEGLPWLAQRLVVHARLLSSDDCPQQQPIAVDVNRHGHRVSVVRLIIVVFVTHQLRCHISKSASLQPQCLNDYTVPFASSDLQKRAFV